MFCTIHPRPNIANAFLSLLPLLSYLSAPADQRALYFFFFFIRQKNCKHSSESRPVFPELIYLYIVGGLILVWFMWIDIYTQWKCLENAGTSSASKWVSTNSLSFAMWANAGKCRIAIRFGSHIPLRAKREVLFSWDAPFHSQTANIHPKASSLSTFPDAPSSRWITNPSITSLSYYYCLPLYICWIDPKRLSNPENYNFFLNFPSWFL